MKRWILRATICVILGLLVTLGLGIGRQLSLQAKHAAAVSILPDFVFFTLDGTPFRRADLAENQPVIFVYFTTKCVYCRAEIDDIRSDGDSWGGAQILLTSNESAADVRAYLDEIGLSERPQLRVLLDRDGVARSTFGVRRVPSTFVYGSDWRLARHFRGATRAHAIRDAACNGVEDDAQNCLMEE